MKEIRAVLAQMMFLQLWFEAASAGYRAEAASTAANIDLCWKVGTQAQTSSPGVRILRGISSFPKLSLGFSWPVLAMWKIWLLVKLPSSRKKAFDGLKVPVHQPGFCCLHTHEEKAARQPGICCDCCLVPAARYGRHGRKRDNRVGDQIHLFCIRKTVLEILQWLVAAVITLLVHIHPLNTFRYNSKYFISPGVLKMSPCSKAEGSPLQLPQGPPACRAISV